MMMMMAVIAMMMIVVMMMMVMIVRMTMMTILIITIMMIMTMMMKQERNFLQGSLSPLYFDSSRFSAQIGRGNKKGKSFPILSLFYLYFICIHPVSQLLFYGVTKKIRPLSLFSKCNFLSSGIRISYDTRAPSRMSKEQIDFKPRGLYQNQLLEFCQFLSHGQLDRVPA